VNEFLSGMGQRLARYLAAPAKHYTPTVVSGGDARWPDFIEPCDVLLVEGSSRVSSAIKYLTQSTWSHSAICVGAAAPAPLVEADVAVGVAAVPFSKYLNSNVRICRPIGITREDRARLIEFVVSHIGDSYDLKNVFDLARFLLPTPPVPTRWRRNLITFGSGEPTKAICSSLIAQAFDSVRYPILPVPHPNMGNAASARLLYRIRAASTYTPRDFDLSPYFAVIKPTIERRFDYQRFPWVESG
jgi:permuted papain-like amidase YaeF/Yiix C92 family enzyme